MRKKIKTALLLLSLILCLCSCADTNPKSKTFYTYFDTVVTVYSYANESTKSFESNCSKIEQMLDWYNKYFDIYHEYSGLNNLCTVNRMAGQSISVNSDIIELLKKGKEYYQETNGETNIMMGAVLRLWNTAINETHKVPGNEQLKEASEHCSIESLILDEKTGTVMIADPLASVDVGAIAKGFATEKITQYLKENGVDHYVINAGGNVRLIGAKPNGQSWKVAIRNPKEESGYSKVLKLKDVSCVTSGIYERNVEIDGKEYHHIIDKDTLFPARFFDSVSVVCQDSSYADALSTALSCMSLEEGLAFVKEHGDAEVLWILSDGTTYQTEGLEKFIDE